MLSILRLGCLNRRNVPDSRYRVFSLCTALGRMVPTVVRAVIGMKVGAWTLLRGARTTLAWLQWWLLWFPLLVELGSRARALKKNVSWLLGSLLVVLCGRLRKSAT